MDFNGQVAIVTGAARGVGRATAHLFAQRGAKLGLLDVDFEKLNTNFQIAMVELIFH